MVCRRMVRRHTIRRHRVGRRRIRCHTLRCHAIRRYTIRRHTIRCQAIRCHTICQLSGSARGCADQRERDRSLLEQGQRKGAEERAGPTLDPIRQSPQDIDRHQRLDQEKRAILRRQLLEKRFQVVKVREPSLDAVASSLELVRDGLRFLRGVEGGGRL